MWTDGWVDKWMDMTKLVGGFVTVQTHLKMHEWG